MARVPLAELDSVLAKNVLVGAMETRKAAGELHSLLADRVIADWNDPETVMEAATIGEARAHFLFAARKELGFGF